MTEFNITYQSAHGTAPETKAVNAVGIDSGYSFYNGLKLPTLDPAYNWMIFGGSGLTEVTQVETEYGVFDMLYFAVPTTSPTFDVFGSGDVYIYDTAIQLGSVRVFDQDGNDITETAEILDFSIDGLCSGTFICWADDGTFYVEEGGFPPLYWTNDSELQSDFLDKIKLIACWGTSASKTSSGSGGGGGSSSNYYTPYTCEITDPETVYDYSYTLTEADLPTLTAAGYTFKGWTLKNGTPVSIGDLIVQDTELIAVWESAPTPTLDPTSMLLGWLTGERVKAMLRKPQEKVPVAYLYNGVQLPDINEVWTDKETYPYAYIVYNPGATYHAYVYLTSIPLFSSNDAVYTSAGSKVCAYKKREENDYWDFSFEITQSSDTRVSATSGLLWASVDCADKETGSVLISASEPVPVYE